MDSPAAAIPAARWRLLVPALLVPVERQAVLPVLAPAALRRLARAALLVWVARVARPVAAARVALLAPEARAALLVWVALLARPAMAG